MSSGFFGFFAHTGFLSVLEDENILPKKITGSSAGALIGGLWASGCSTNTIKNKILSIDKNDFFDPIGFGGYLKGKKYRDILNDILPINNIKDCRVELSLSAYEFFSRKTTSFTSGNLVDAIYASTAVPFMFQPLFKNKRVYFDGGIKDRPSLASTKPGERIFYHHLNSNNYLRRKLTKIPQQDNLVSLIINNLPKIKPNDLLNGRNAYNIAKKATKKALNEDIITNKSIII